MKNYVRKTEAKDKLELNMGSDYIERLNEIVEEAINKSEKRAEANGRKTVYARDL